jgi:hypothetical protein
MGSPRMTGLIMFMVLLAMPVKEAASSPPEKDGPETVVARLYRDYAWEAVMHRPDWPGLLDQPREILEQYFDEKLASRILRDRVRAGKHGIGRLDFDPIWDSQDPAATDLNVSRSGRPAAVAVQFRCPGGGETVDLLYEMTMTRKGWRIADIRGSDWSLISILDSD